MTSLNNPELRKKTDELMKRLGWVYKPNKGGTYYWQKFNGVHKSQMTLSEARLLTELCESELANRERVARIAELEVVKSQITEAHMILSPCGYRHTIDNILHPEIIEDRIAQLQSQLNKETT